MIALSPLPFSAATASAAPFAANRIVTIANFAFTPASITVNVGDTITWTNTDAAAHSARSTNGTFDTGTLFEGQSKTITFSAPGTFAYICGIHGAAMSGTVIVRGQAATATPAPTAPPTQVPATPSPTPAPTTPPTPQPTLAPTAAATPTPNPSASFATSALTTPSPPPTAPQSTTTPSPSATILSAAGGGAPTVAVAAASSDGAPGPLLAAGGAVIIVGLLGAAFVLRRR